MISGSRIVKGMDSPFISLENHPGWVKVKWIVLDLLTHFLAAVVICFFRISRITGVRKRKPVMSVTKPGVIRNSDAVRMNRPSIRLSAGKCPILRL